jgi:hypothetical protein
MFCQGTTKVLATKNLKKILFFGEKKVLTHLDYERPVVPGKAVVPHCVLPFVLTSARQR